MIEKNKIKKIAVLKGPGIGDVITSIPLLRNLHKNFPKAKIIVFNEITYGAGKDVLKNCPYVDKIENLNHGSIFSMMKTIRKVRNEKFDIIIDSFPSTWKTALFCHFSDAKIRMGYDNNNLSFFYNIKIKYKNQNKIDLECDLLEKLGVKAKDRALELFFNFKKSNRKISQIMREHKIKGKLVVIHAGRTEDVVRTWEDSKWAQLADLLIEKYRASVIFIGSEMDSERASRIIGRMRHTAVNLTKTLSLEDTAALINRSNLFLCINGGPMHIAAALKKPLIVLTGDTKPGWDPYGKNSYVLRKNTKVFRDTHYRRGNSYYMRLIEVSDVMKLIKKLRRL
jgi:ADP-heptose:LPS heptosyltransferase